MLPEASVVVDGVETSVVLDEDVFGAVLVDSVVIEEVVVLLEAAVDVEVEGVLIVLVEVLPCAVVVDSEDVVSDVVVLLEPNVVVEAVVAGFEVVDDVVGVVYEDDAVPSDVVDVLLVAAVVVE